MKVRILNNTIRFRVSREEIEDLSREKVLSSLTLFPSNSLVNKIIPTAAKTSIDYIDGQIILHISHEKLQEIAKSDQVGFSFYLNDLKVLFEKDFKCLTDRGEDESKLYENPRSNH